MATGSAWVVHHVARDGTHDADTKLLGVYSSAKAAQDAVQRFLVLPGFREFPAGFTLDEYPLDKDHWTEGF